MLDFIFYKCYYIKAVALGEAKPDSVEEGKEKIYNCIANSVKFFSDIKKGKRRVRKAKFSYLRKVKLIG